MDAFTIIAKLIIYVMALVIIYRKLEYSKEKVDQALKKENDQKENDER